MIESAGGVVWRAAGRHHEVLVVHRSVQCDWSLPKGRRRSSESALECALREVREETGLLCAAGLRLPEVRYIDRRGRPRRIRFWAMEPRHGEFLPNDEVDDVRWATLDRIGDLLTHSREIDVVTALRHTRPVLAGL
jgi:8-oxo-dGTP diphosphatase